MTRFALEHKVVRAWGDTTVNGTRADDEVEVFRIADVLAELTTASPWEQSLVEVDTGRSWVRRADRAWKPRDGD